MLAKEKYKRLKEEFAQKASWAIWADGNKTERNTYREFVEDLSIFSDPDLLGTLHNNFVVVGSHPSEDISKISKGNENWVNFHAGTNDFKLRYAFKDTPIWGSYMTDLHKEHPVEREKDLKLTTNNKLEAIQVLKAELDILGGTPDLIALGRMTERALKKHFKGKYKVLYLSHPGARINKENLKDKVEDIIKNI